MPSDYSKPSLSAIGIPDAKSTETQEPTSSTSPSLHQPKIHCRPARHHDAFEAANSYCFRFLAEGAANAVFRLVQCPSRSGTDCFVFEDDKGALLETHALARKVLRISKGNPKTLNYQEIMQGFENDVLPLFRKTDPPQSAEDMSASTFQINESFENFTMKHEGVSIAPEALRALIPGLPTGCVRDALVHPYNLEERGILLPDMSSIPGSVATIEIKPKWLLQSPNAPRDAYLCRTCALHALRKARKKYKKVWICPLALVAGNKAAIEPYIRQRSQQALEGAYNNAQTTLSHVQDETEAIVKRAVPYLTTGPGHKILQHICRLQAQLDSKGVNGGKFSPEEEDNLRLAMTLRDCSLFIRIPWADENAPIEAKLGDLDYKSPGKLDDWMAKEDDLLNGGWYVDLTSGMDECWVAQGWKEYVPHYF